MLFRSRYHWFPYAWVGAVDRAAGAGDYEVLTRVAPIVATGGILLCVVAIALRYVTVSQLGAVVVVFTVSPVFGDWWRGIPLAMAGSFSQLFAMAWLFAVPLALVGWLERPRAGRLVALGALMLALVGGKATHAVIAAVVLAATWLTLAWRRDPRARAILAGGVAVAIAMAVVGRWLFAGTASVRFLPSDWLPYVQGDLYERRGLSRAVATVAYLVAMVGVPAIAALRATWLRRRGGATAWTVLAAGLVMSTMSNRLHDLNPNGLFAVHSAVSLVWVGVALGAVRVRRTISRPSWVIPAAVGLAVLAVIPDLDSGAPKIGRAHV